MGMFGGRPPGTSWNSRIRRVLDLVDTPREYGSPGQALVLNATGRVLEWLTVNTLYAELGSIILFASTIVQYDSDDTGMVAAIAAATSGDTIWIPPSTYANDYTVPAGVTLHGESRADVVFSGHIALGSGSTLESLSVIRSKNDTSTYYGVMAVLEAGQTAEIFNCTISVTQAGGGSGYGLWCGTGTLEISYSHVYGSTGDGDITQPDWLPPGLPPSAAIAVYIPKGAASLADSYIDLTGNGNDAYPGVAPGWNAGDGWIFTDTKYLETPMVPDDDHSMVVFWGSDGDYIKLGINSGANNGRFYMSFNGEWKTWGYDGAATSSQIDPDPATIMMGMTNQKAYRDGAYAGVAFPSSTITNWYKLLIGTIGPLNGSFSDGEIYAFAYYNQNLTDAQMLSVHNWISGV